MTQIISCTNVINIEHTASDEVVDFRIVLQIKQGKNFKRFL